MEVRPSYEGFFFGLEIWSQAAPTREPTGANARANGANARANARAQEIGPPHKLLLYQRRQDP